MSSRKSDILAESKFEIKLSKAPRIFFFFLQFGLQNAPHSGRRKHRVSVPIHMMTRQKKTLLILDLFCERSCGHTKAPELTKSLREIIVHKQLLKIKNKCKRFLRK